MSYLGTTLAPNPEPGWSRVDFKGHCCPRVALPHDRKSRSWWVQNGVERVSKDMTSHLQVHVHWQWMQFRITASPDYQLCATKWPFWGRENWGVCVARVIGCGKYFCEHMQRHDCMGWTVVTVTVENCPLVGSSSFVQWGSLQKWTLVNFLDCKPHSNEVENWEYLWIPLLSVHPHSMQKKRLIDC